MTRLTGKCLCGAVRFSLPGDLPELEACHCADCRSWTGGGPFLGHIVRKEDVAFVGEENITVYRSSEWAERGFCKICGTNLFYRMAGIAQSAHVSLCRGAFDDPDDALVASHMFVDQIPSFYSIPGDAKAMTQADAELALKAFLEKQQTSGAAGTAADQGDSQ